ncbi:hypothetical protein HK405_005533 [Cladochytrium tenue]|nr:hypothetical protein HK405_005533 [Cladochytrium tenue]
MAAPVVSEVLPLGVAPTVEPTDYNGAAALDATSTVHTRHLLHDGGRVGMDSADHAKARENARVHIKTLETLAAGLSDEEKKTMQPHQVEVIERLRKIAAGTLKTFMQGQFKGDRFIYELLQNCDDNSYKKCTTQPSVTFDVYPGRMVVRCNEDGFTKADVDSICTIYESTKSKQKEKTGEKGSGFKSVFMVAEKVVIKSGYYSFFFENVVKNETQQSNSI